MRLHPNRSTHWAAAWFFLLLLEPMRCGVPTVLSEAGQLFPPTIVIIEVKTSQGFRLSHP